MMVSTISIRRSIKFCNFYMHSRLCSESDILSVTRVLGYNIVWKCFTHSFVGEKQGEFFYFLIKKTIDAEVLK